LADRLLGGSLRHRTPGQGNIGGRPPGTPPVGVRQPAGGREVFLPRPLVAFSGPWVGRGHRHFQLDLPAPFQHQLSGPRCRSQSPHPGRRHLLPPGPARALRSIADPALRVVTTWTAKLAVEAAALLLLLVLGAILVRRRPAISFGILWFFLWLAPTNSFIPRLDVVNDRQLYLAILGPAWIVAWLLRSRLPTQRGQRLALAIILVLSLGVATYHRNQVYANEIVFWEDVTRKAP